MKKLLAWILALAMVLSLAACGQSAPEESPKEQSAAVATDPVKEPESSAEEELYKQESTMEDGTPTSISITVQSTLAKMEHQLNQHGTTEPLILVIS